MGPGPFGPGGLPALTEETIRFIEFVAVLLLLWFVNMALTGWLAGRKGREDGLWAVVALFLGPIALIAVLLAPRKPPRPESEAARLAATAPARVRLLSDSQLELDVAGRLAWLRGALAARINGRPSFNLAASAEWQWSEGTPMTDEERAELRREVPQIGRHDGWVLTMDAADLDRARSSAPLG